VDSEYPEDDDRPTGQREAPPIDPVAFWKLFARVNALESTKPLESRIEALERLRWQQETFAATTLEAKKAEIEKAKTTQAEEFALRLEEVRGRSSRRGRIEGAILGIVASILSVIGAYIWSRIAR
jgi:hypothetical protein